MTSMRRDDIVWTVVIAVIAVAINPFLKSVGLLPADVFRSLGVFFPGLPQIVFGPLMAFILLLCFIKTGEPLIFPVIGILRALSLTFVFPVNPEHSGTAIAAIIAGIVAAALVNNVDRIKSRSWLPVLAALYAGLYAAFNYATTFMFGPAPQTATILASPHIAIGIVLGSAVLGYLLGLLACRLMRPLQAGKLAPITPRFGV